MARHLLWRGLQALGVLALMSVVIYGLIGLMPGDPLQLMIASDPRMTPEDTARLQALYGLDKPWTERYWAWVQQALSGDLGYSRLYAKPVLDAMGPALVNSAILMISALCLSLAIALPLGIWAAARPDGWVDRIISGLALISVSTPTFWLGLMLIVVFAVILGWLPAGGMESVALDQQGFWDSVRHAILPVTTLGLAGIGGYIRHMRAAMIDQSHQDYVRTARAKGCSEPRILLGHQLRNAWAPIITLVALDIGALFSGALITETIFAWPGMGRLIFEAIMGNDFNLALVGLLFATLMTLVASLLADLAHSLVDKRGRP